MFLSTCLSFFSLTTIVGWYFFAESNVKLVFNSKSLTLNLFKAVVIGALVTGTLIDATFVWKLADLFMGIMALPNIIAILFMSREVIDILNHYDSTQESAEVLPVFEAEIAA
jgi:AGCS family alanine or glycine:cation symporter